MINKIYITPNVYYYKSNNSSNGVYITVFTSKTLHLTTSNSDLKTAIDELIKELKSCIKFIALDTLMVPASFVENEAALIDFRNSLTSSIECNCCSKSLKLDSNNLIIDRWAGYICNTCHQEEG